jgi:hypothetical protein
MDLSSLTEGLRKAVSTLVRLLTNIFNIIISLIFIKQVEVFMPIKDKPFRHIGAKNERAIDHARRSISTLGEVAQRQNANAILPDGRLALFYQIKLSGQRCTCCATTPQVLDEHGNMPNNVLNQVLSTDVIITEIDFEDKVNTNNNVEDIFISDASGDVVLFETDSNSGDDETDLEIAVDPDAIEDTSIYNLLPAFATNCPVCYGTGYVGGFDVLYGTRYVLEAFRSETSGQILYEKPVAVSLLPKDYVIFNVVLPLQTKSIVTLQLWNRRHRINLPMYIDDTLVNTHNFLNVCKEKNLLGKSVSIKVVNPFNEVNITHLEFQSYTKDLFIDISNTENMPTNEFYQLGSITVVMPPVTDNPNLVGSIIAVGGRHVRVTSANNTTDWNDRVWHIELQTRPVQPYEVYGTLFTLTDRIPIFGTHLLSNLLYDETNNGYSSIHNNRYNSIANQSFGSESYGSNVLFKGANDRNSINTSTK